jgi:hypothetical protein
LVAATVTDPAVEDAIRARAPGRRAMLLRPLTPVIAAGIRALFGHRHRRLQQHFIGR